MKLNVDKSFISALIHSGELSTVKDKQIRNNFLGAEARRIYKFCCSYFEAHGKMPSERVLKRQFPDYEFDRVYDEELDDNVIGTEEPLTYWCDELRNKVKHNKLGDTAEEIIDKLNDKDLDGAYSVLKKALITIEDDVEETTAIDVTQTGEDRKARYTKRRDCQGLIGIPTGISGLDFMLKGFQKKQLITLIASTGVGKTWLECIVGAYMQRNNYRVLHFTTEMSEEQIIDRYDALQTAYYHNGFNYSRFTDGKLTPEEEANYFDYLENISPKLEKLIVDTAEGASGVSAKIDLYEPDIVMIDGAYLMIDDLGAKDDWLRVTNIWRSLKKIAKNKNIPIFVNTQTDSTTSKKTGAGLENIGFSKAIGHDSDIVFTLFRDEQMIEDKEAKVKLLKHREGSLGSLMMTWDFKTMNFQEIYSEYDKSDVEEVEEKSDEPKNKSGKKKPLKKKKNKGIELE